MPTKRRLGAPLILMFGVIIALVAFAAPANAGQGQGQGPYQGQGGGGGGQGPYQGQGQGPHHRHPTVSVSHERARAGDRVQCRGTGFQPGETVTIGSDNHRVGQRHHYPSAVADSSGAFFSTVVLEANFTGTQTITVTGTTSGAAASVPIVVAGVSANASPPAAAASRPAAAGLAFTGAAVLGIGSLGGLLLVGGAALVLAGRRRKVDA